VAIPAAHNSIDVLSEPGMSNMAEGEKVIAVYRIAERNRKNRFVVVEILGHRSPESFAQRLNERQGMNRTIELAAVLVGVLPAVVAGAFHPAEIASTLEDAQDMALKGAWRNCA
jgi:trimethylamine:corrinoid methyltransferase-like protein